MFTTGSKAFFGMGALSLLLAAAYGWSTGGDGLGPLTAGYKGGVGDHLGYSLLLAIALGAIFLGLVAVATRDAAPSALAELAGTEVPPREVAPAHRAYWPIVAAFGAGLVTLGLVISSVLFVAGFILLLAVLVEWTVLAWSDRATGDPDTNRLIRARIMGPFEVPLAGALIVAATVVAISRVLLTSSELGAVWVATALGVVILGIGALFAAKPRLSPNVVAGVLALCAVGVVAAGVASAARGERVIEHHEEEEHPEDDSGLEPNIPEGTNRATSTTTTTGEDG
jgi:hypothetical protein